MKNTITISWHILDVQNVRPDLTDAQARDVLEALERNHDASIGVNWDVIDATITACGF